MNLSKRPGTKHWGNQYIGYSRTGGIRFFKVFHVTVSVSVSQKRKQELQQELKERNEQFIENLICELRFFRVCELLLSRLRWKRRRFLHVLECPECQQEYVDRLKLRWRRITCR